MLAPGDLVKLTRAWSLFSWNGFGHDMFGAGFEEACSPDDLAVVVAVEHSHSSPRGVLLLTSALNFGWLICSNEWILEKI